MTKYLLLIAMIALFSECGAYLLCPSSLLEIIMVATVILIVLFILLQIFINKDDNIRAYNERF